MINKKCREINFKKVFLVVISSLLITSYLLPTLTYADSQDQTEETNLEYVQTTQEIFNDFLQNYETLTEEEIKQLIEDLQLFIDDDDTLHSTIEGLDLSVEDNESEQLIRFLDDLRQENIATSAEEDQQFEMFNQETQDGTFSESPNQTLQSMLNQSLQPSATINRIQGAHRFETAVQVSREGWTTANTVVIANSHEFADALAGVPLAAALDAPILPSQQRILEPVTINEIQRLGATQAIILGGEDAISLSVENELNRRGLQTRRIQGETRYETAQLIGDEVRSRTGSREAFIVNGENFADAMSVASIAAEKGMPIYLTQQRSLSSFVRRITNGVDYWVVAGGSTVVSGNVTTVLNNSGAVVRRLSGIDRYATNLAVLNHFGLEGSRLHIAAGSDFVDALTGSVLAAKRGSRVVLVEENRTNLANVVDFARENNVSSFSIFGGTAVVSNRISEVLQYLRINGRKPIVYIDPGHGGHDPGPVYGGTTEKELNLAVARYLRDDLNSTGNYDVVLSRNSDVFASLDDRTDEANRIRADIYVSIHHNAMGGANVGTARGIETFIHHRVASGFGQETNRNNFRTGDPRIAESLRLADAVHPLLINRTGLNNRGIKGNNFHVLRESNMPAILVELGFMDNPSELAIVRTASYQQTAARAIRDGINTYFGAN